MNSTKRNNIGMILRGLLLVFLFGELSHTQVVNSGSSQQVGARWIYTYNHAANYLDEAKSVIYGGDGNIYAVGGTKGFSLESYDNFTVISLDTDGGERWQYFYNKSYNLAHDCAYDVVYGVGHNLYAAGITRIALLQPATPVMRGGDIDGSVHFNGPALKSYFTVINLDDNGYEKWVYKRPRGCALSIDYGIYDNNTYAAGYVIDKQKTYPQVVSLDADGNERWVYTNDEVGFAKKIVYGKDGNLYVVGQSLGSDWTYDFTILSLDANGTERWVRRYDGDGLELDFFDIGNSIIYGIDNNIYAAGVLVENNGLDFAVISLTTGGVERWVYEYDGPGHYWDMAFDIDCDEYANLYAAGISCDTLDGHWVNAFAVLSLTNNGAKRWLYHRLGADIGAENQANAIVCGADEKIYAAGKASFSPTNPWYDFAVIALTKQGNEFWTYNYDGTATSFDEACSIVYGDDGYLYAAGYNTSQDKSRDFTVISLPQYRYPPTPPHTNNSILKP